MNFSKVQMWCGIVSGMAGTVAAVGISPDITHIAAIIAAVVGGWGLVFARGHGVSDEEAGVSPAQKSAIAQIHQDAGMTTTPSAKTITTASVVAALLIGLAALGITSGCSTVEKEIDPPLPGQTNDAPFLAFTNNSAYLLGHAVSSNDLYLSVKAGTGAVVLGLKTAYPLATNYFGDVQVVLQDLASSGASFSMNDLTNAVAQIPVGNLSLPDSAEVNEAGAALDALGDGILSFGGAYLGPLIDGGTNSAPYVQAVMHGLADGL